MAISEQARHQMYSRLETVLGAEEAATLMEHLPPVGWADVATKSDLRTEIELLGSGLRREMAELRTEVRTGLASVNGRLSTEIGLVRGEIGRLRADVGREIGELRGEMVGMRGEFRGELGREIGSLRGELQLQGRNIFFQMVGLQISSVALIAAVVRFL